MPKRDFPEKRKPIEKFKKPREEDTEPEKKPIEITSIEDKPIIGYVTGCNFLNIRNKPGMHGHVVGIISAEDNVTIDLTKSTNEWYYVTAVIVPKVSVTGYCMRKYVSVEK